MTPPEKLRIAGTALFGADWRSEMAVALGPHHPDGPRNSIDDRLVRRWAAGERDIPDWVVAALPVILLSRAQARESQAAELKAIAVGLRHVADRLTTTDGEAGREHP